MDVRELLRWTVLTFGEAARFRYQELIKQAVRDIGADPERLGSQERPEIMVSGARTYHLELSRNRVSGPKVHEPRHLLLYRRRADGLIEVARILHDGRDLQRHLPEAWRRHLPSNS